MRAGYTEQDVLLNIAHLPYLPDDDIRLTKKRVDPGAVDHFFGQLLDGRGETTVSEFRLEFVPPCLDAEPIIGSPWISHP